MRAVIQRVSSASVTIAGNVKSSIKQGFIVLLGIGQLDKEADVVWLCKKISNLRIFSDEQGLMNMSLHEIEGNILLISQFTLMASYKKGNRPSFIFAARPEQAIPLYEACIRDLSEALGKPIATGTFGANMQVNLVNDGPVTIIIDSKNPE
ncbi:MAG: D-tyrosyl-tRNA(Tyr) deacylase [Bacteroidetes bacterium]|nr:D-tyrosyl-tRNA(Tyr) deacylase [Bacteroidota bacterium]MBS1739156.1 D-tyrosyl-tRNA(Tyr) deacylase [Bacteroidota bacterium]